MRTARHAVPRPPSRRRLSAVAAVLALLVGSLATAGTAHADTALISQGRPAIASSTENVTTPAAAAFDGNTTTTRWSSAFSDPQWIAVDLGATAALSQVVLTWQTSYAVAFQVQVSDNFTTWTTVYATTTGAGGRQVLSVSGTGRYVRMFGTARHTAYGYSLFEFQVYGSFIRSGCGATNRVFRGEQRHTGGGSRRHRSEHPLVEPVQ